MPTPATAQPMSRDQATALLAEYFGPKAEAKANAQADAVRRDGVDLVNWAETHFFIPETETPIKFMPHQKVLLILAFDTEFARQQAGVSAFINFLYSTVKKSGKTAIASVVARWIVERWGKKNEVLCMANDLEQARGRVYEKALTSIELDPAYDKTKRRLPGAQIVGSSADSIDNRCAWKIIERHASCLTTAGVLKAVSSDYKGEAGSNPTATFWSELWGYTLENSLRMWDELTPVPTRPKSIRWVETYAGFEGESGLLNDLHELAMEGKRLNQQDLRKSPALCEYFGVQPDPSKPGYTPFTPGEIWPWPDEYELPIWVHPRAQLFAYWDSGVGARRMPWQTPEYYSTQEATLRPTAYRRLHLNEEVSSVTAFVPIEWWDRPQVGETEGSIPPITPNTPVVVSADASVTMDCTCLQMVGQDPRQGREGHAILYQEALWVPSQGGRLDYGLTIEPTLLRWIWGHCHWPHETCTNWARVDDFGVCVPTTPYNVVQVPYDQYQLHDLMTRVMRAGLTWTKVFSQGTDRMIADKRLADLIRDAKIHYTQGSVPHTRQHLLNSAAQQSPKEDTKLRLIKKTEKLKIDLAVALSMGAFEALRLNLSDQAQSSPLPGLGFGPVPGISVGGQVPQNNPLLGFPFNT